ncbi:MAG: signal peptidase I [Pseudomonadota bacterium]
MARKSSGGFGETIRTVVYAVLIAVVIRTFAYEPFNIPSGSMVPTLLIGDYLFVSKFSYGYSRYSFPFSPDLFHGRIFGSEPRRGDVVVFKKPTDNNTDYIKRIVGLPGDTIQMIGGILHINGVAVQRERIGDYVTEGGARLTEYIETLPGGVKHPILEESDSGPLDNTEPYVVPPDHYFAMGDNRDNSQDSRVLSEVGYIPDENLVGRAEFLFFSTNGTAGWLEPWKWFGAIRYGRLFQAVR